MKYLKMLGLAAVAAMALMALLGAGSASATVLCKTYKTPCPAGWDYPAGTEIHATVKAGTSVQLRDTGGSLIYTCANGTIKGKTSNAGSATETVKGTFEAMTFSECSTTVDVLAAGQFEIHYFGPNTRGALTVSGNKTTVASVFGSCVYGTGAETELGVLNAEEGMENAELEVEAVLTRESGAVCPTDAVLAAKYVITTPKPLFFKKETK